MSAVPYFPFYPADYLADTRHLSAEQHGAYLLLLMTAWGRGGRLPNDPKKLARIACVSTRRWNQIAEDVLDFWETDGDEIVSRRMEKEYQKASSKSENRSAAGRRGGHAKALKDKKAGLANAMRSPCHLPEPEPLATNVAKREARVRAPDPLKSEQARETFARIWPKLPPQARRIGEPGGMAAFGRAVARGSDPGEIEKAVGPWLAASDGVVERFDRWLDGERWREWLPRSAAGPDLAGEVALFASTEDDRQRRRRWDRMVGGPCPDEPGCRAPPDTLAKHGFGEQERARA